MTICFLDSNVILRFILQDIKKQAEQAEQFFEQARAGQIRLVIIPEVIIEVDYVLKKVYSRPKHELVNYLLDIVGTSYLEVRQRTELVKALEIYAKVKVDLVDTFLHTLAGQEDAEVLSFDKDFSKLKSYGQS